MGLRSLLVTFFWVMLGVLLIGAAVFYSTSPDTSIAKNTSLVLMLLLMVAIFILLPGYLTFRVIKDWGIKPKTQQEIYSRRENEGIGFFMITNILLSFYMFANAEKIFSYAKSAKTIYDLEIFQDPVVIIGLLISFSFLSWSCYNLARSKGQSGWYAVLSLIYPIGFIILLFFPNKFKK